MSQNKTNILVAILLATCIMVVVAGDLLEINVSHKSLMDLYAEHGVSRRT